MTKSRLIPLLYLFLALVVFTSCSKDDDPEPNNTDLLTLGEWDAVSGYSMGQDVTNRLLEEADYDINQLSIRFDRNGEYRETYGRTILGTWVFSDNEEVIMFDTGEVYEHRATVTRLTNDELYLEVNWFGPLVELRFTKRQQ